MVKVSLELARDQLKPSGEWNQEMEVVPSPSGSLALRAMESVWPTAGVPWIRKAASPLSMKGMVSASVLMDSLNPSASV